MTYFRYFDGKGLPYQSVDNYKTLDEAIAHLWHVDIDDPDAMLKARNATAYRRRVGADILGASIRGSRPGETQKKTLLVRVQEYLDKNFRS